MVSCFLYCEINDFRLRSEKEKFYIKSGNVKMLNPVLLRLNRSLPFLHYSDHLQQCSGDNANSGGILTTVEGDFRCQQHSD